MPHRQTNAERNFLNIPSALDRPHLVYLHLRKLERGLGTLDVVRKHLGEAGARLADARGTGGLKPFRGGVSVMAAAKKTLPDFLTEASKQRGPYSPHIPVSGPVALPAQQK